MLSSKRSTRAASAGAFCLAVLVAGAALARPHPRPVQGRDRIFALVVGYNGSDDPELAPLSYADDDALRYGGLLGALADRVVVLSELDADTRRMSCGTPDGPPTRAALTGALRDLKQAMAAARDSGDRPVLYFVYSGHGNYDAEGRGYVHLQGGRFTTRDLFHHVISANGDDPVILVVDACNAALLVNSRGPASDRRPARPSRMRLEDHPNVGVVLASSSIGETHEWGRYLAGVFSHEVRSGLVGPADLNDDGRVTFPELAAFVAAANARVTNPTVRITPYIRPPLSEPQLALIDLGRARFPIRVRVDRMLSGHAHVVDRDMVRYADFNKTAEQSFWLGLTRSERYVIVRGQTEYVVPPDARGDLRMEDLTQRPRGLLTARGAQHAYFERTLFLEPYDRPSAYRYLGEHYAADLEFQRIELRPWYENTGAWMTLGGGLATVAAGVVVQSAAFRAEDRAQSAAFADDRQRANEDVQRYQTMAYVLYGAGGAALLGSAIWFAVDQPITVRRVRPLTVQVGPSGVLLRKAF